MKKLAAIAIALGTVAALGSVSASARPIRRAWHYSHGPYYDYAPGYDAPAVKSAPYTPYPYGGLTTGTQENREEWDPSYVGGAPG